MDAPSSPGAGSPIWEEYKIDMSSRRRSRAVVVEGAASSRTSRDFSTTPLHSQQQQQQESSFATPASETDFLDFYLGMSDEQCLIEEATVLDAREMKSKQITIEPPSIPKRNAKRGSTVLNGRRASKQQQPPQLPQQQKRRTSMLLDHLKYSSIESAQQTLDISHEDYLSEEEGASSSSVADEEAYSDSDYSSSVADADEDDNDNDNDNLDDEEDDVVEAPLRGRGQQDTARAVSVIYIGKPAIVDWDSPRGVRPQSDFFSSSTASSSSSHSSSSRSSTFSAAASASTTSSTSFSSSTRSSASASERGRSNNKYPSRQSSLPPGAAGVAADVASIMRDADFLLRDPYPPTPESPCYRFEPASSTSSTSSSRSAPPVSMANNSSHRLSKAPSTAGAFQRFSKSISLVKKSSRPHLQDSHGEIRSISSPIVGGHFPTTPTTETEMESPSPASEQQPPLRRPVTIVGSTPISAGTSAKNRPYDYHSYNPSRPPPAISYQEKLRAARKSAYAQPPTPTSALPSPPPQQQQPSGQPQRAPKRGILGMKMSRRLSVSGK
ncbi:hypothetical protein GGR56DRAFT_84807 [Xylariaceae sp. FL0804]|nr:hypothetical protein GGR56DRAFT_84807 [Xylariaceae sp. FL0804]